MPAKKYSKDSKSCQVTFSLPKDVGASSAHLCGDFNDWNRSSHRLKRAKDGSFKLVVKLPAAQSYQYRFLLDDERWENDWQADGYQANSFGGDNSVLHL